MLALPAAAYTAYRVFSPDPQVAAKRVAQEVRTCQKQHNLARQHEVKTVALRLGHVTKIRSCDWPPPLGADEDGYREITARTLAGPGSAEAGGDTVADRITGGCKTFKLTYLAYAQGVNEQFIERSPAGRVTIGDGERYAKRWPNTDESPNPRPDEAVHLHDGKVVLKDAVCM